MACNCTAVSIKSFGIGGELAPACKATVTIKSECQEVDIEEVMDLDPEDPDHQKLLGKKVCRVTYQVIVSKAAKASAVALTVGGSSFEFPTPIAAGKNDFVSTALPRPAECTKKKIGKVKLTCPGGGKAVELDEFEVCVLRTPDVV
jgi:hypothetical protein